jgi:AraC-like DNA-binding protein
MKTKKQVFQTRQHMFSGEYEIYHYQDIGMPGISLHHHDFYEVYFFLTGIVTYQIEGRIYELKPGDLVLINSSELHQAVVKDLTSPYERIVLWLNPIFIKNLSTELTDLGQCFESPSHKNVIRTDIESQQQVRALLNKLLNLAEFKGFGHDIYYKTYVTELLLLLNEEMMRVNQRPKVEVRKNRLIDNVINYIETHIEEEIPIDTLAEVFFLSKFHLCREFKDQTGTTLHRFMIQKKLILAKDLIMQHLPITEVYQQSGFGDYSNFFRAFRNEYHMTPKQYYDQMLINSSLEE